MVHLLKSSSSFRRYSSSLPCNATILTPPSGSVVCLDLSEAVEAVLCAPPAPEDTLAGSRNSQGSPSAKVLESDPPVPLIIQHFHRKPALRCGHVVVAQIIAQQLELVSVNLSVVLLIIPFFQGGSSGERWSERVCSCNMEVKVIRRESYLLKSSLAVNVLVFGARGERHTFPDRDDSGIPDEESIPDAQRAPWCPYQLLLFFSCSILLQFDGKRAEVLFQG